MQHQALPQNQFLSGLKNLINAIKQLQLNKHPRLGQYLQSYNGLMKSQHLPRGVCKGYALACANNRTTADTDSFIALYAATARLAHLDVESVKAWILQHQDEALRLLNFNDGLMMKHRIKTAYPDHYSTDFHASGLTHQVAISVNLPPQELAGLLNIHILSYLNLPTDPETQPQQIASLMISNGTHSVSVNIRFRFGAIHYRLNDANDTFSFETKEASELCRAINSRFELVNQYDGQCVSYRIDVLTEKNDPVFESILKRLEDYTTQLPEYLPDELSISREKPTLTQHLSHKQLLQKLIECYRKGQSRVGFLQDLLLYFNDPVLAKSRQYAAPIQDQILQYLSKQPSMALVLRDYRQHINTPSRNGFTWLHQAIMTHEKHVVWWLMQQYQANPNLLPLFRQPTVAGHANDKKSNAMIRGAGEDPHLLNLDEAVQIIDGHFVHSHPAHYAALLDDLELYSWLRDHGANMDLQAGNGTSARQLVKPGGHIKSSEGRKATPNNELSSLFSLFVSVQGAAFTQESVLRNQRPQ